MPKLDKQTPPVLEVPEALDTDQASQPYVGRWHRLISTTNWEKGRIISQWREALIDAQAPAATYSDEAWALRVGGVSGQHVGRLRRVYQRFGGVSETYPGLFWSHFQAALDWDDAEMWLEGAVQSQWSVSAMRDQRWETLSAADKALVQSEMGDAVGMDDAVEMDEDSEPTQNARPERSGDGGAFENAGPLHEGPDFGDEFVDGDFGSGTGASLDSSGVGDAAASVRPFENLPELPDDLAEAFDAFKLAILRHKATAWRDIRCQDLLASLDALKELALAASPESAPY